MLNQSIYQLNIVNNLVFLVLLGLSILDEFLMILKANYVFDLY